MPTFWLGSSVPGVSRKFMSRASLPVFPIMGLLFELFGVPLMTGVGLEEITGVLAAVPDPRPVRENATMITSAKTPAPATINLILLVSAAAGGRLIAEISVVLPKPALSFGGGGGGGGGGGNWTATFTAWPHSPQKGNPGGTGVLQLGQSEPSAWVLLISEPGFATWISDRRCYLY